MSFLCAERAKERGAIRLTSGPDNVSFLLLIPVTTETDCVWEAWLHRTDLRGRSRPLFVLALLFIPLFIA